MDQSISISLKLIFYAVSQITFGILSRLNKEILRHYSTLTSTVASIFIMIFFTLFSFIKGETLTFLVYQWYKILLVMSLLFFSGKLFVKHQSNLSATVASVFNQPPTILIVFLLEKCCDKKEYNFYDITGLILLASSFILLSMVKDDKSEKNNKIRDCLLLLVASLIRGLGNYLFNKFVIDDFVKKNTCSYAFTAHFFNALVGFTYYAMAERNLVDEKCTFLMISFFQGIFFSSIILLTTIFIASKRLIYTSLIHLINDFMIDIYLKNKFTKKRIFVYFLSFIGFVFYKNREVEKFFKDFK